MTLGTVTKLDIPEPAAVSTVRRTGTGSDSRVGLERVWYAQARVLDQLSSRRHGHYRYGLADGSKHPRGYDRYWPIAAETYEMIDRVRDRYGIDVEVTFPTRPTSSRSFVNTVSIFSMNRKHCASPVVRCEKSRPLARLLEEFDAWVTGLRRDQASSRAEVAVVEADLEHGGKVKVNPLAHWTEDQVWDYVRANDVPTHPSTLKATQVSAARRVRDRSRSERIRAPGAGGGNSRISRNVAFTIPRIPMVTWWQVGCASRPMTDAPHAAASAQRDTIATSGALQLSCACA